MFTIDLTLKNTPFPLSIQRKLAEDAEFVYHQILEAMRSGNPDILELTCERQTEKKVAIRSAEITGVQLSQKASTAAAGGRAPGFFSLAE